MPPRSFVFVNLEMWVAYHRERRAIDRRFPAACTDPPEGMTLAEHWSNVAMLREAARVELRQAMRHMASQGFGGSYAIPV